MNKFKKIDIKYYVLMGLRSGTLEPVWAAKTGKVLARRGKVGEEVITYTDQGIVKKNDVVTSSNDMVLMKANKFGYPIIDSYGYTNEWIVKEKKFFSEYIPDDEIDGLYQSISKMQLFVPVLMDMVFLQNGKEMFVKEGGYLNITNIMDIYCISKRDFEDTYSVMTNNYVKKVI